MGDIKSGFWEPETTNSPKHPFRELQGTVFRGLRAEMDDADHPAGSGFHAHLPITRSQIALVGIAAEAVPAPPRNRKPDAGMLHPVSRARIVIHPPMVKRGLDSGRQENRGEAENLFSGPLAHHGF